MMKILLIEDSQSIGDGLTKGLSKYGFVVDWFVNATSGNHALTYGNYDAVILDLTLPDSDGLDLLNDWRIKGVITPILILTARNALPDKLNGLNHGADDYLCKPFALDEVAARLQALIRRSQGQASTLLKYGNLCINTSAQTVSLSGNPLILSHKEYQLLLLLVTHPTHIFSRAKLEDKLYNWDQDVESNAIQVHIHHLRKKIGNHFIITHRNLGYQLGEAP